MNKKVILELRDDDWLCDQNGMMLYNTSAMGVAFFDEAGSAESGACTVEDIIKLKDAGFDPEDISKLKREGII